MILFDINKICLIFTFLLVVARWLKSLINKKPLPSLSRLMIVAVVAPGIPSSINIAILAFCCKPNSEIYVQQIPLSYASLGLFYISYTSLVQAFKTPAKKKNK